MLFYVSVVSHTHTLSPAAASFSDNTLVSTYSELLAHVSSAVLSKVEVEIEIEKRVCPILKTLAYSAWFMRMLFHRNHSQGTTKGFSHQTKNIIHS